MTVQLPDHFVIAGSREIQIRQAPKVGRAGGHLVQIVAPPVDGGAGLHRHSKDRETVEQNLVCDTRHLGGVVRVAEGGGNSRGVGQQRRPPPARPHSRRRKQEHRQVAQPPGAGESRFLPDYARRCTRREPAGTPLRTEASDIAPSIVHRAAFAPAASPRFRVFLYGARIASAQQGESQTWNSTLGTRWRKRS